MALKDILRRGWYQNIDDAGGGGDPPEDDDATLEAEAEEERRAALSDDEREAEDTAAEEARVAGLSDEEREAEEAAAEQKKKDEAAAAAKAAEEEEERKFKERAAKLGYKAPDATPPVKPEVTPPPDPKKPPELKMYRADAYKEAAQYEEHLVEDADGNMVLNQRGVDWAEERAIQLRLDDQAVVTQEAQIRANIAASKPNIVKTCVEQYTKDGVEPEVASVVGAELADEFERLGPIVFQPDPQDSDPPAVREQRQFGRILRDDAYDRILGRQYRKILAGKEKAGGDGEGDSAPDATKPNRASVTGGGGDPANGSVYNRVMRNPANKEFLKEFQDSHGRKPTAAEVADFIKGKDAVMVLN